MMWTGDYTTQIGPDHNGHDRCWAAVIASALLTFGWQSDPFDLMREVAQKGPGEGNPASLVQLSAVAHEYGLRVEDWTVWPEAVNALLQEGVVIALLNNRDLIPRAYPFGAEWEALHFVRIHSLLDAGDMVYCYDPLCYMPQPTGGIYQGPTVYTRESLSRAIMATPYGQAGVVLYHEPPAETA